MKFKKPAILTSITLVGALTLTGCSGYTENSQRKEAQKSVTLDNSLEKANLKEKLERENDANAVRYVYVLSFAQPVGYYVIKGKVSSSGSQLAPENDIVYGGGNGNVVDSAQDDGTYGDGDPGIFFFLADGGMVETDLNYISSDVPLALDVPRLTQ